MSRRKAGMLLGWAAVLCALTIIGGFAHADRADDTSPAVGQVETIELGNGIQFELMWIPPGEFIMGSPGEEHGHWDDEAPRHRVHFQQGFWMGKYEVTQEQWRAVMGNNPSRFKNAGGNAPVEMVSWRDCQEFLQRCTYRAGRPFRLPSEAEWEYACRAGTQTALYTGPIAIKGVRNAPVLDPIAWYAGNSGVTYADGWDSSWWKEKQYDHQQAGTHPVGRKKPNAWGLCDMLGNVWEWCQDDWHYDYNSAPGDGTAWKDEGCSVGRLQRGGSWDEKHCRAAHRRYNLPMRRFSNLGFRVVLPHVPSIKGTAYQEKADNPGN